MGDFSQSFSVEHKYEHGGNNKPIRNGFEYEIDRLWLRKQHLLGQARVALLCLIVSRPVTVRL